MLLPELWEIIIPCLPVETLIMVTRVSKLFSEIGTKALKKLKMKNYPRKSRAVCHIVPYDQNLDDNFVRPWNQPPMTHYLTRYLYDNYSDLVRGDLIFYDHWDELYYLFDGIKVIYLNIDNFGRQHIPKEFTIINDGVPIDYWDKLPNSHLWFDHSQVLNQCISNTQCEREFDMIFTTFICDNVEYKIVYYYEDCSDDIETKIYDFTRILCHHDKLLVESYGGLMVTNENNMLILPAHEEYYLLDRAFSHL
jgi:hypothetical protein